MGGMMGMMASNMRQAAGGAAFSASLNGTNQYLSASNAAFAFTGNFTVEGWFRPTDVYLNTLFSLGSTQQPINFYAVYLAAGAPIGESFGEFPTSFRTGIMENNVWYHVALVRSGSIISLYLNGTSGDRTGTLSGTIGTGALNIGFISGTALKPFRGNISNFRVSNSAVYTSNFTPATSPLTTNANTVALLPLTNTPFVDISTNAFTVTNFGITSVSLQNPFY